MAFGLGSSLHGTGTGPNAALGNMVNLAGGIGGGGNRGFFSSLANGLSNFGNFMSSDAGAGLMGFGGSLANLYGMNKAFDIADAQLDILENQENRAATAQNLATSNSQSLALQMTTPGTPEHEAVKAAIAQGTYQV